jgi:hypothetical protein
MRKRGAWISWLSLKIKVDGLSVVWLQNHWDGLASTTGTIFSGLASKPVATVSSSLTSKSVVEGFPI